MNKTLAIRMFKGFLACLEKCYKLRTAPIRYLNASKDGKTHDDLWNAAQLQMALKGGSENGGSYFNNHPTIIFISLLSHLRLRLVVVTKVSL